MWTIFDSQNLSTEMVIIVLVFVASIATTLSLAGPMLENRGIQRRMKAVALERDRIRNRERERMQQEQQRRQLRQESKTYMRDIVDRFDLRRHVGTETAKQRLAMAGYRSTAAEHTFLFFRLVAPLSLLALSVFYVFFAVNMKQPVFFKIAICIAATFFGFKLPEIWVTNLITKRQVLIQSAWPDALDLLVICVESGMPIEQAFQRVAGEIRTLSVPLAEELVLLTAELSYLPDRRSAYEGLSERTDILSVKVVVQALIQAERHGTHLGEALRTAANETRDQRMSAAERKAAALPPMLTVPMIIFFLPVLFVIILGPAILKVIDALS